MGNELERVGGSYLDRVRQGFIVTRSGHRFNPFEPTAPAVSAIQDIAYSLSYQVRYGGHCEAGYSVGQHSVVCAGALRAMDESPEVQLCGLLHDAGEALGLPDLPAPVKALMPQYRELEDSILEYVAGVYGLPWPFPRVVREVDLKVRRVEVQWCLSQSMRKGFPRLDCARYGAEGGIFNTLYINPLPTPAVVQETFLRLYYLIQGERGDAARPREHGVSRAQGGTGDADCGVPQLGKENVSQGSKRTLGDACDGVPSRGDDDEC